MTASALSWREVTLGELESESGGVIQTGPFGSQLHAHDYSTVGMPVVMPTNIRDLRISIDGIARVSDEHVARLSRHKLMAGDIVYSRRGDVEKCALVVESQTGWLCGTGCLLVRVQGPTADARYLAYALSLPETRGWISQHAVGATMPNLNTEILRAVPVCLPPVPEQREIAAALGALDDKIESNRRVATLTLDLAEALYLAACESGSEAVPLKVAGKWLSGGTPSTSASEYWGGDLPWISATSMKSFFIDTSERCLTEAGQAAATNVVPAGTVLFVVRGMSLKSEFRLGVAQRSVAFGQDCKAILPTIDGSVLAVALLSMREEILDMVDEAGHGTGRLQTDLSLSLSFNLCRGVGQLVLVLFGVSQRHEATTA
ncbi:hypothetical protein CJ179_39140 [Rhodococcus sp. ACS1]|uniref:restriction endonuclease subunit S n=1 Tax=Rhodococcus sp. ACS1 TaxID=2028570 RepID=UPI000BB14332|nr:restriction endonuclease subunit S [Rhodococcus sp. ACS1]PBC38606.1 hypothetical protein CJ179_39140 [Rhodococcus sp. ACS1]